MEAGTARVDVSKLDRGEWLAAAGGLLLGIGVFLPWYGTEAGNRFSNIDAATGTLSCWEAHSILRWLLLAAASAPFILAWIIVRQHQLSWPRGQMTMVVAIAAFGLIAYNGLIDRPGDVGITLKWGWFVALLGSVLMLVGSVWRQSETEIKRKPPGTI